VKTEFWTFGGGAFFFLPLAVVYGVLSSWEPVGTVCLFLTGGLASLMGAYLWLVSRRIGPRPEDDVYAEIADGAGEQGIFPPHSWWPLAISLCIAMVITGLAVGWWLSLLGGLLALVSLVGWLFEFYRGAHAH